MTSTTLTSRVPSTNRPIAIADALIELRGAWAQLLSAVALALRPRRAIAPLGRAQEAAWVRDFARGHMKSDPGFAADLFAAADRHELEERH